MIKVILLTMAALILSCHSGLVNTVKTANARGLENPNKTKKFPVKSFVKIRKTLHIKECKKMNMSTPCIKGEKFRSIGSGVSIGMSDGGSLIVTAGHVCQTELSPQTASLIEDHEVIIEAINLKNTKRKSIIVSSVLVNSGPDLCLLYAGGLKTEGVLLSENAPKVGDKVYNIAAPAGIFHPPTVPILQGIFSGPLNKYNSMITIPAVGGSSGSAIIDEDMRLVGILFATHPAFNTVTLCSSYDTTVIFLNHALKKFRQAQINVMN